MNNMTQMKFNYFKIIEEKLFDLLMHFLFKLLLSDKLFLRFLPLGIVLCLKRCYQAILFVAKMENNDKRSLLLPIFIYDLVEFLFR